MSRLDRGPDKYARPDLRFKLKRLRALAPDDFEISTAVTAPEFMGELQFWRDLALQLGDALEGSMDRLDDAEILLEEGGA